MKAYRLNKNRFLLVSHPHYPSRFPYFNRLYALICFHIGTINLAFRRVRVCVCLVGFASLQSPWAHTLRHPCLACSSRCTEPFHSRNLLKNTSTASSRTMSLPPLSKVRCCHPKNFGRLPEGLSLRQPFSKPHYPLPRTMPLPPLSKVRCCRPKKFGRLPEGLLPIRTNPPKPALSLALHHILTPLAKGELLLLSFAQPTIEDSSHQHRRKHFAY